MLLSDLTNFYLIVIGQVYSKQEFEVVLSFLFCQQTIRNQGKAL